MDDRAREDAAPTTNLIAEIDSLTPHAPVGRRGFVLGSLTAGFAAAVAPTGNLLAQTIATQTDGLTAGEIAIPAVDGSIPAYRAMPAGKTRLPTVLVVQEIFGVHEYIKDVCRRFARAGYIAIAPELYARQGDPSKYTSVPELFKNVVSKVPDEQVMSDLDAAARWAAANGGNPSRLGITGFCWGGRIVWLYAAHNPRLKAGVAWYGRLTGDTSPLTPRHPYDVAAKLHAPVLGLYGGEDSGIPLTTVIEMKNRLANGSAAAKASEFVVYRNAPHAFHADYRPSYRKEAAEDGWRNTLAWFRKHRVS